MSSVGAGLPLIVVGVVAVALAASGVDVGGEDGAVEEPAVARRADPACFREYFRSIPAERVFSLEEGIVDRDVIGTTDPKEGPIGFRLTSGGRSIGGLRLVYFAENGLFRVESVVDGACRPTEDFENVTRPATDKHVPQNFDELGLRLSGSSYQLDLGAGATIRVTFVRVAP